MHRRTITIALILLTFAYLGVAVTATAPQTVTYTLDASRSTDPDNDALIFEWFHYAEAGFSDGAPLGDLIIKDPSFRTALVTPTLACRPLWKARIDPCAQGQAHVILAVTDDGVPALTTYRRVILHISSPPSP